MFKLFLIFHYLNNAMNSLYAPKALHVSSIHVNVKCFLLHFAKLLSKRFVPSCTLTNTGGRTRVPGQLTKPAVHTSFPIAADFVGEKLYLISSIYFSVVVTASI